MEFLICGSRDWDDRFPVYNVIAGLRAYAEASGETITIVHGAARGADSLAEEMCQLLKIDTYAVAADWDKDGRAAGPLRNQRMLDEHNIQAVFAFRLRGVSRGTDDMVRRSKEEGIPTYVINKE